MRPFRSRVLAALVTTILSLGVLGTVAFADDTPTTDLTVEPSPSLVESVPTTAWPEDPWDLPTIGFPEDPWPDL
ncbi:MAG TPA: hypothetical protein VEN31_12600 [Candidatus Bathyarchaeia archaeon]|nr:hypothetical protein [Candidatus Bathyarchaeia archaeon]